MITVYTWIISNPNPAQPTINEKVNQTDRHYRVEVLHKYISLEFALEKEKNVFKQREKWYQHILLTDPLKFIK